MASKQNAVATIEPEFLRTRDVARVLAVSERQVQLWTRAGTLRAISIPGIRARRFRRTDVEELVARWAEQDEAAR